MSAGVKIPLDDADARRYLRSVIHATGPGPLDIERRDSDSGTIDWIVYGPSGDFAACLEVANPHARHDAVFIVAAHATMPALLDQIEVLRAREAALIEDRHVLREAVKRFDVSTHHQDGCSALTRGGYYARLCTCGLTEAMKNR